MATFLSLTGCRLVDIYEGSVETTNFIVRAYDSYNLIIEIGCLPETSVRIYQTRRCRILKDIYFCSLVHKSRMTAVLLTAFSKQAHPMAMRSNA